MTNKQYDIELEAALLKSLSVKSNYDAFLRTIDTRKLIPNTVVMLNDYKKYYNKYGGDIDWDTFHHEFVHNWHKKDMDEQEVGYYRDVVLPIVRESVVKDSLMIQLLEREAVHNINESIEKGFNQQAINDILSSLRTKLNIYQKDNDNEVFKLNSLDLSVLDNTNGLPWFLNALQDGLGCIMPGQFIVVAADSNAGKSAFCISEAVHIFKNIQNTQRPVLYCTSEDTKEDLVGRFLSNLYSSRGITFDRVSVEYEKMIANFEQKYDESLFIGMQIRGPSDMFKIKQKIDRYNPCVVIIDMIDKLSESDNIQDLTKLYQELRAIANDGIPVIGTSQSGNTTYFSTKDNEYKHRKNLTEKDLANSKSGKQGAAYCMIMIGIDDDVPGIRHIAVTKRKRGRGVNITCVLNEQHSLYEELI